MPRRTARKNSSGDALAGFGSSGTGSSQRSIKEVFGAIAGGTSQALRSIKEQFGGSDEDRYEKGRQSKVIQKGEKSTKVGTSSKQSRRSKMDKSQQSKRGLRSGLAPSGRVPQARGTKNGRVWKFMLFFKETERKS